MRSSLAGRLTPSGAEWLASCVRHLGAFARLAGLDGRHELSLTLCDNATIRRVNRRWRDKDAPTDVLSFPQHELRPGQLPAPPLVGDIMISLPFARGAARELGVELEVHLRLLLAHGLLHLLGFDHQTERQYRQMIRAETRLLAGEKLT